MLSFSGIAVIAWGEGGGVRFEPGSALILHLARCSPELRSGLSHTTPLPHRITLCTRWLFSRTALSRLYRLPAPSVEEISEYGYSDQCQTKRTA